MHFGQPPRKDSYYQDEYKGYVPPPPQYGARPPNYGPTYEPYPPVAQNSYIRDPYPVQRAFGASRNGQQSYDDVMHDINTKASDTIQNNLNRGAAIQELEMILDGERRRARDLRTSFEAELEAEKRQRVEFENKLIRLKDDSQKREVFISELEYKLQSTQQENDALTHENRAIKDEVNRMQEMYGLKIRELEDKLSYLKKQNIQNEDRFRVDFDRMKSDYDQRFESMNREWEYRVKAAEEKCRNLNQLKGDMEQEIRHLQDNIMKTRLEAEEELREAIVRVQDEEMRKFLSNMRSLEQKLKASEEARENFARKNQELIRDIAERDKHLNNMQMDFDQGHNRFKQDLSEQHNQLNQANIARDKLRSELAGRDAQLQRLEAEMMDMQKQMLRERETRKQDVDRIVEENSREKRVLEEIRDSQARKLNDQEKVIRQMEQEIDRHKNEHERLVGMLQNNINRSIYQTISETSGPRYDTRRPQFGQKYD